MKFTKKFTKETFRKAYRTFFQTAIGYIVTHTPIIDFTDADEVVKRALIGLIVSSIAAGIAAVMNLEQKDGVNNE